jgi:hypothetical protein
MYARVNDMTDKEFINYVYYHSMTERALFRAEHIVRIYSLVGIHIRVKGAWMEMHADVAHRLCEQARLYVLLRDAKPQYAQYN